MWDCVTDTTPLVTCAPAEEVTNRHSPRAKHHGFFSIFTVLLRIRVHEVFFFLRAPCERA
jgi:hypothetical protein